MRVLMLNYEYPPLGGGAANANRYMLEEFSRWGKQRVQVDLVTSSSEDRFASERIGGNIRVLKLDVGKKHMHYWTKAEIARWTRKAYSYSRDLLKSSGDTYDLCHCWFGWPGGLIGHRFRRKLPYLVALRGSDVPGFNPRLRTLDPLIFKRLSRKVWGDADLVVANSQGLKKLAQSTLDRPFEVIYNGVDVRQFKPSGKKSKDGPVRLISTGRLIERKGYEYLIDALQGLKGFSLTLIGEGNIERELRARAKERGVAVEFLGRLEHSELPRALNRADVFVLPSLNEGMSNSLLEAMACGLPVVVTDTGGSRELVKDNGIVVKKASSRALRSALKKLDPGSISEMGKNSRKRAMEFSWEKVCKQYYGLYEKMCGE